MNLLYFTMKILMNDEYKLDMENSRRINFRIINIFMTPIRRRKRGLQLVWHRCHILAYMDSSQSVCTEKNCLIHCFFSCMHRMDEWRRLYPPLHYHTHYHCCKCHWNRHPHNHFSCWENEQNYTYFSFTLQRNWITQFFQSHLIMSKDVFGRKLKNEYLCAGAYRMDSTGLSFVKEFKTGVGAAPDLPLLAGNVYF